MLFVLVMTVGSLVNVSYHQVPLTPPVCKEMLFDQLKEGPYLASCLLFKMISRFMSSVQNAEGYKNVTLTTG